MTLIAQLESARKELLDLGLRNPLLNFRARSRRIDVIDERSSEVYRILVNDGRRMTFAPLPKSTEETPDDLLAILEAGDPDWGKWLGADEELEDSADGVAARHRDTRLQTRLDAEQLQARLLSIHANARAFMEEQGVNVLYLALGFLHWYEAPSATIERHAPVLLVPVELSRSNVRERFHLSYSGDDLGTNLSLAEKLRLEFAMSLPEVSDADGFDIAAYLDLVQDVVETQPRWKLAPDEIVLGFFSFGKFLMYKDLDVSRWPATDRPENHSVLVSLLGDGFGEPSLTIPDDSKIDQLVNPTDTHHVVDADSSQILAMLEIDAGNHLVIQGPPGTGKSQTITNVIAEAVGAGKQVLFVSEKMAALEVVKRQLDRVGLGDASLELHSHKLRKKAVLTELERTLALGKPVMRAGDDDIAGLVVLRDRLNAYCEAVNAPILNTRFTPVSALGELCRVKAKVSDLPTVDFREMREWNQDEYLSHKLRVQELERRVRELGVPSANPFWGTRREALLPSEQGPIRGQIDQAFHLTHELRRQVTELARTLALRTPELPRDVEVLSHAMRCALNAPDLKGVNLRAPEWVTRADDLRELIETGSWLTSARERYDALVVPAAWNENLLVERQAYTTYGGRWWRWLVPAMRRATSRLKGLCRREPPRSSRECVALIDAIMESQARREVYVRHATLGKMLFGNKWRGEHSKWRTLAELCKWISELHDKIQKDQFPDGLIAFLEGGQRLPADEESIIMLENALNAQTRAVEAVGHILESDFDESRTSGTSQEEVAPTAPLADVPLADQEFLLRKWGEHLSELGPMVRYNAFARELRALGLDSVVDLADHWEEAGERLVDAFDSSWFTGLLDTAYLERPELRDFDRTGHEHAIEQFRKLDRVLLEHNQAQLVAKHWVNLPTAGGGEVAVIKREINKKRRHLPIRRLISEAGRAIQAAKPVFMMSPMSIAAFLPPGAIRFDLVVFDEASQVRPVDAFGALLRGTQCVVVGDSRQLPPTRFFDFLTGEDPDAGEDDITGDLESVLGLFRAKGARERMLRWHYRSRHESLIAVSNHEFYDNRLFVFPSPGRTKHAEGLSFEYLPATHYERGRTRTNVGEARAVAAAIMAHAHATPDLTLGVATFSSAQRDAIELQLEVLRRRDLSAEPFFAEHPHEPFFIKNLENVQGDERDVILISIGYGKTSEGFFAMNFGPLNQQGGERRLNVLITRARCSCRVFANFTSDDLDLRRSSARGVVALKRYLQFAADGALEIPEGSVGAAESPFEEQVIAALTNLGYDVDAQVGYAGFRIDIGIRDPDRSGRYFLGIECDGAMYHSARSARDRDRLRQEVLENLGWRIHRIWSTDWFRDPDAELRRVVASIERAKMYWAGVENSAATFATANNTDDPSSHEAIRRTEIKPTPVVEPVSYTRASLNVPTGATELHEVDAERMAKHILEVVNVESPVHIDLVTRRITEAAGLRRAGVRIRATIERGAKYATRQGWLHRRAGFLSAKSDGSICVRDRSNLEGWEKKAEYLPPEEVAAALCEVIEASFSIPRQEAIAAVLRKLGIRRATRAYTNVVERAVTVCLAAGTILAEHDRLMAADRK